MRSFKKYPPKKFKPLRPPVVHTPQQPVGHTGHHEPLSHVVRLSLETLISVVSVLSTGHLTSSTLFSLTWLSERDLRGPGGVRRRGSQQLAASHPAAVVIACLLEVLSAQWEDGAAWSDAVEDTDPATAAGDVEEGLVDPGLGIGEAPAREETALLPLVVAARELLGTGTDSGSSGDGLEGGYECQEHCGERVWGPGSCGDLYG